MADYPISNVPRRVQYVNSGVGPYAFAFEVLTQTDIAVYRGSTKLTLTTDYTVTINANGTGSVTLVTAGTGNITIVGARAIQRSSDYTTGGDLFASTLNTDLDSQTIFSQQLAEDVDLSIKVPVYAPSSTGLTVNPEANKVLGWDSTGTNLINIDAGSLASIATYATAYADVFVSNGVAVAYTLSRNPGSLYNLDISVDGVTQEPVRDYSLLGNVVTFTSAMPINSRIVIKYKEGLPNVTADSQDIRYLPAGTSTVRNVQAKLRETVSVKDFGAVGDGIVNDTAAILTAIASAKTLKADLIVPSGTYILTGSTTLEIDVGLMSLIGQGEVVFDCTGMTATYAMQIYNSINTYPDGQLRTPMHRVSGIRFNGDSGLDGILVAHPTYVHNHQILIEGCVFDSFDNNVSLGSNAWRVMFNRCNFNNGTTTNLVFLTGAVNAGESMCFLHCQFVGSKIEINYAAQVMFYSSSLLVCPLISNSATVFCQFFGGNIENPGSHLDESYIDIQGTSSWFGIHGTGIVMNTFAGQSFTKALFVVKEASSTLALFGVLLPETPYYTASTLETYSYTSGAGRVISYGGMAFPLGGAAKPNLSAGQSNCIYNYGFELGNTNGWVVTPYGAAGSTAVASTTAKDNGTYGLLVTAVNGGGINITQTMSCVAGQLVRANCNARVASSTTATVGFVQVAYTTDNGTVVATYGAPITSANTSWGSFGGTAGSGSAVNPVPPGATKVTFTLNVQPGSGGTNVVYFDDAVLNIT